MSKQNNKHSSNSKTNQKAIKDFVNTGGDLKELLSNEKLKQSFALFEKIKVFELVSIPILVFHLSHRESAEIFYFLKQNILIELILANE